MADRRSVFNPGRFACMADLDRKKLEDAPNDDRSTEFKWTPDDGRRLDTCSGSGGRKFTDGWMP